MIPADTFDCPHCNRQYRYKPELEGKIVRCKCGEKFTVEAAMLEEPDSYDLDPGPDDSDAGGPDWSDLIGSDSSAAPVVAAGRPCPNCGKGAKPDAVLCTHCGTNLATGKRGETKVTQQFSAVHETAGSAVRTKVTGAGLLIHGLGFLFIVGGAALAMLGGVLVDRGNALGTTLAMIGGLAALGGMPMIIVGPIMGLAAPAEAGRTLLIISIVCLIAGTVLSVLIEMGVVSQWFSLIENIPTLVGAGCFLGFLQNLSVFLDDDRLYERTESLLKLFFGLMILTLAMFIPIINCFALIAYIITSIVFAFAYTITVCQAGLAAIKS